MTSRGRDPGRRQTPVLHPGDPGDQLKKDQERLAQLETYAADLNRTYAELRRHLHHMTVLHEVNLRIAAALDPDEVLAGVLDSLGQMLAYRTAAVYLMDLGVAVPPDGPHTLIQATT